MGSSCLFQANCLGEVLCSLLYVQRQSQLDGLDTPHCENKLFSLLLISLKVTPHHDNGLVQPARVVLGSQSSFIAAEPLRALSVSFLFVLYLSSWLGIALWKQRGKKQQYTDETGFEERAMEPTLCLDDLKRNVDQLGKRAQMERNF